MLFRKKSSEAEKILPWVLLVGGAIGVLAAGILVIEKFELLSNPNAALSCDLNPIVACGSVINTPQASAFGFPNPLIGMMGFSVVATIGAAMLAGATFKRWFWLGLQAGAIFGIGFVTWLQYQSIFQIGALCPYCMVVWAVTIPIFVYTTAYNLEKGHTKSLKRFKIVADFIKRSHLEIVTVWYLGIVGVIVAHFWYFWRTLF